MSAIIRLPSHHPTTWRLSTSIAQAYRSFRMALRHRATADELDGLSDRYLRDVGVDRRQISAAVSAEITRATLVGTGWARSRSCGLR
ncbi:hypothetical protein MesoLjLc_20670 [Mesorhizobium sp. L-8-10]|uniref:DUF1127 domain-containing protein n=1 Tax=Mesorhizobium sp. L-8-10 TaxID=2744523 RepID=UPI0019292835|nr:DUF1127 domain-containing protein [Mesorhizobium sp. L-8-10]BCH30137.1 hypothetical protein MesoLjLc_20670 [Mesorhizobium sp. L-8-10]